MKLSYFFIAAITLLLSGCSGDYQQIFNGTDLSGWQIHGHDKWYVEDGELVCESGASEEDGYLLSLKSYGDFELRLEFFPVELKNGSGVFFRTNINGDEVSGWKVEIAATEHGTGSIYEKNGRGWLKQISEKNQSALKSGQWNRMKIKVVGGSVSTWLNGELMVTLSDEKIEGATGIIALQIQNGGGVKMRWRNIKIKELDKLEKVNHYF